MKSKTGKIIAVIIFVIILSIIQISMVFAKNYTTKGKILENSNNDLSDTHIKLNVGDKTINVMGNNIKVQYEYSVDNIDVYKDINETEYLQKNGKIVGFIRPMNQNVEQFNNDKSIDENEAKNIVNEYAKNNVYDFEQYTFLEVKFNGEYNEYQVYYNKKIGNCLTMDLIYATVDLKGNITSFLADKQGMFDSYKGIEINEEEIEVKLDDIIIQKYKEQLKKWTLKDKTFKIKNNKLVLECIIEVNLNNNYKFLEGLDYYLE